LYEQATLLTRSMDAIKDQDPTTIQMTVAMLTPMVMEWMQMMHRYNPEMAEVVLETWAKEHPRKSDPVLQCPSPPLQSVSPAPDAPDLSELVGGACAAADEDGSCCWSETGSI
jgi:hypothetical protein